MEQNDRPCRSIVTKKDKHRSYLKKPDLVKKEQKKHRYMLFTKYRLRKHSVLDKIDENDWSASTLPQVTTTRNRDASDWIFVDELEEASKVSWWKFWKF